jgi:hypothetical protein
MSQQVLNCRAILECRASHVHAFGRADTSNNYSEPRRSKVRGEKLWQGKRTRFPADLLQRAIDKLKEFNNR